MDRIDSLRTGGTQAGSSDQGSGSDQGTSAPVNRGGRPPNWFRQTQFTDKTEAGRGKHNRVDCECMYCNKIVSSRVADLQKHCLTECKKISPQLKRQCEQHIADSTVSHKRPNLGPARSSAKQQDADVGRYMHPKVSGHQLAQLNRKMFLFFCMCGIACPGRALRGSRRGCSRLGAAHGGPGNR